MLSRTISDKKINLKKSLHEIIHDIPEVWDRFKDASPLEEIKGFGLPLGSKKYAISGHRFLLCGDAAGLIDPFSGEGIETAMESGKFAAEIIMKNFSKDAFKANDLKEYDARVYKKMWKNFRSHYLMQKILGGRVWLINNLIKIGNIPWINKRIPKAFY
jgi:flavin-dependent dehydrogenase